MPAPRPPSPDDLLTVADIQREYRIDVRRTRKLVRDGQLRHLIVGVNRVLIPRWVFVEWIRDAVSTSPTPLLR